MSNKINNYIYLWLSCACLISAGCNKGIDIDKLVMPENIIESAIKSLVKSDPHKLIDKYASIEKGTKIADNFEIDEPTDAALIEDASIGDSSKIFIKKPLDLVKKEHLFRALAAGAIRRDSRSGNGGKISYFNLPNLKSKIDLFAFSIINAKKYFIRIVKELNSLASAGVDLIVDLDDLPDYITPREFAALMSKPGLIILSSKNPEELELLTDGEKISEVFIKGLNPGHTFILTKSRLDSSQGFKGDDKKASDLALSLTKALTATDPYGSLSNLGSFFRTIEPEIESSPLPSAYKEHIMKALALHFKANYEFLIDLKLDNNKLSIIHDLIKSNRTEYDEQLVNIKKVLNNLLSGPGAIADIRDGVLAIRAEDVPGMLKKLANNQAELEAVRNHDLPYLQKDLSEQNRQLEDEIIKNSKKIMAQTDNAILALGQNLDQNILREIKKAKSQLENAIADAEAAINKNTKTEISQSLAESLSANKKNSEQIKSEINSYLEQKIATAQKSLSKHIYGAADNTQAELVKNQDQNSAQLKTLVEDNIAQAIKKIISNNKDSLAGLSDGINQNTNMAIKKAKTLIDDAITNAQIAINKNTQSEISQSLAEILSANKKNSEQIKSEINSYLEQKIAAAQKSLSKNIYGAADNTESQLIKNHSELKSLVEANIAEAIKKIISNNQNSLFGLNNSVNQNTNTAIKKAKTLIDDAITSAQTVINKNTDEQALTTRDEIKTFNLKNTLQLQAQLESFIAKLGEQSQKNINKHTSNTLSDAQNILINEFDKNFSNIIINMKDKLEEAIKKITGQTIAELTKATQEINHNTKTEAQKTRDLTSEELAKLDSEMKKIVEEAVTQLQDVMLKLDKKNAQRVSGILKGLKFTEFKNIPRSWSSEALSGQLFEGYNNAAPAGGLHKKTYVKAGPFAGAAAIAADKARFIQEVKDWYRSIGIDGLNQAPSPEAPEYWLIPTELYEQSLQGVEHSLDNLEQLLAGSYNKQDYQRQIISLNYQANNLLKSSKDIVLNNEQKINIANIAKIIQQQKSRPSLEGLDELDQEVRLLRR